MFAYRKSTITEIYFDSSKINKLIRKVIVTIIYSIQTNFCVKKLEQFFVAVGNLFNGQFLMMRSFQRFIFSNIWSFQFITSKPSKWHRVQQSDFDFISRIKATNVPRIVNGETYYEANQTDPLIQRIIVPDVPTNYIVEIELTEQEFNTWNTFCRKITKLVESKQILL